MREFLSRTAAAALAAVMTGCCAFGSLAAFAEDEKPAGVKVTYDIGGDRGLTGFEPSAKTDMTEYEETYISDKSFIVPKGTFELEGYTFSGWTYDGIYGYEPGDRLYLPKDQDEIVLKGLWTVDEDELMKIGYEVIYKDEVLEKPFGYKDRYAREGKIYTPASTRITLDHAFSKGVYCDELVEGERILFTPDQKLVMPDHPITLITRFLEIVSFTYYTGDVDRVNGKDTYIFERNEGSSTELADVDRLSRSGFELTGWHSSFDDQIYKPNQTVTVPGVDVVWTAVWTPIDYKIVFNPGNGAANIKVTGTTDTTIICPEPDTTVEGMKFAGWKDANGMIYPVGSEYFVYGALPGLGISLKGVWVGEDEELPTTPKAELYGDANCDGQVTIADAAAILQYLGNKDRYPLTAEGAANADCYKPGSGVTTQDAVVVQQLAMGVIKSLPVMN